MRHPIIAACGAFTIAGTLSLSAQVPPRPQTPQPSKSTPTRTDERTMTVAGCLKAWDASMSGPSTATSTPGAASGSSAPAMAGKFVLTNVQTDAAGTSGTAAKPETGAAGATTGDTKDSGKQYVLTADSGVNLQAHLNHQVRVTGKVTATPDTSAGDARRGESTRPGETTTPGETPDPTRPTTGRDDMGKAWPTMAVSSVTMVSATCTGATR